jgi:hypothetical protein
MFFIFNFDQILKRKTMKMLIVPCR